MGTLKRTAAGNSLSDENRLPPYPPPNEHGYYPAIEYTRVSLARSFIRDRRSLGLTRAELSKLAKMRLSTIARIESGAHSVSIRTFDKIIRAIEAERKRFARRKAK